MFLLYIYYCIIVLLDYNIFLISRRCFMIKRKFKRKNILYLSIIISFLLIISGCLYLYYSNRDVQISELVLKQNRTVEVGSSSVYDHDFIEMCDNCEVISSKSEVDTSQLGKKTLTAKIKTPTGKERIESFDIEVIDHTKPQITYKKVLSTTVGSKIDLLNGVTAKDNSKEIITVSVEGNYDLSKVGDYSLFYVASDSSKNQAKEQFVLKVVTEKSNDKGNTQSKSSKGYPIITKNGVTYIDGVLVVNKTYSLPSNYGKGLTSDTLEAFQKMKNAALKEGITLKIISGYRSYQQQSTIYRNYVNRDGRTKADTYSARAGHSEHQTGLAFDLNILNSSFARTKEGKWLNQHACEYGFILRYPKGKTNETGYVYEPWHFRYVGVELATKLYNKGNWITLEDYYGITSIYS